MSDEILLRRIERLERGNRAMKFVCAATIVLCVAATSVPNVFSAFPHGPRQIDAQRFNLVSRKGQLIATLAAGPNGGYLAFYDAQANPELVVGTSASKNLNSVGIAAFDGNAIMPGKGNARMVWAESPSFGVGEALFDPSGTERLSNFTNVDGSQPGSFFFDATAKLRGFIGVGSGGPGLFFADSAGKSRILEGVLANDSSASMALLDANQNTTAIFSANGDDSNAGVQLLDPNGTARLQSVNGTATSGPEILINDSSGKNTWFAPESPGT